MLTVERLDHLVLTVRDLAATIEFYTRNLGMTEVTFGTDNRKALAFGSQKINLHVAGKEFEPKADRPTPGSADLCFIVRQPVTELVDFLQTRGVTILEGPVRRTGAQGTLNSIYLRDPDGNLIELSNYLLEGEV
jgi:catechol 2,3-dioxygenase-like lactoylglutathione lyase family enzyme